jgi:hypothetical protein
MTPKRTTPSKLTTSEEQEKRQRRHTMLSKEKQIHSQKNNTQGTRMLPEQMKRRQKKNINKRFQETANRITT